MDIQNRIKILRTQKGISQNDVAKAVGVDVSSVSYWESGRYEPKASYIYKLAIFFNVSADYLLGLEDESGRKTYTINNNFINNYGTVNKF